VKLLMKISRISPLTTFKTRRHKKLGSFRPLKLISFLYFYGKTYRNGVPPLVRIPNTRMLFAGKCPNGRHPKSLSKEKTRIF
jgi:hypothetical protein